MASNVFFTSGAMQCEWCHSNLASVKFADSHVENGATKVVCPSCFHMLSLTCIRQDLTDLNQKVVTIYEKIEGDQGGA